MLTFIAVFAIQAWCQSEFVKIDTYVRQCVYDRKYELGYKSFPSSYGFSTMIPDERLAEDYHRKYPSLVNRVLTEIIAGGKPRDAQVALAFFVCLNRDQITAAMLVNQSGEDLDKLFNKFQTNRMNYLRLIKLNNK
jgi:hypothetical protein